MNFQLFKRKFLIFSCYDLIFSCPEKDRKMTNRYPWYKKRSKHKQQQVAARSKREEQGSGKTGRLLLLKHIVRLLALFCIAEEEKGDDDHDNDYLDENPSIVEAIFKQAHTIVTKPLLKYQFNH